MSAHVACHLANIIKDVSLNKYFKQAITATVRPIFKKDDRKLIKKLSPYKSLKYFL